MADRGLHGNGRPCDACALRRAAQDLTLITRPPVPCNRCRGKGRFALTRAQIIAEAVEEARRSHWPRFYARTGCRSTRPRRVAPAAWVEPRQLLLPF